MEIALNILIAIVIALHFYFMVLEMFLWDKPYGMRVFGQSLESARASKTLAMNQGLYNGFLAVGLLWGLLLGVAGTHLQIFFLLCVAIAGIFGGITVNRKIFTVQAVPALLALGLLFVLNF